MSIGTQVFKDTVTGAAVTTFASSSFTAFADGEAYILRASIIGAGADYASLYYNADTTDANYRRGTYTDTVTVRSDANGPTLVGWSGECYAEWYLIAHAGNVFAIMANPNDRTTYRLNRVGGYHNTGITLTQLRLVANAGANIGVGSTMELIKITALPDVDVSVTGSATTTLSSGSISAWSTVGDAYLLIVGNSLTGGATLADLRVSSRTASYSHGNITSAAVSNSATTPAQFGGTDSAGATIFGHEVAGDVVGLHKMSQINATSRLVERAIYQAETSISQFDLVANASNGLDVGTFMKAWKITA